MDALDLKYAKSVLIAILDKVNKGEKVNKSHLLNIVTNPLVLTSLLEALEKDGYIKIKMEILGRRVYNIELTEKGKIVAEYYKEIEKIQEKPSNWISEFKEKTKNLSALTHVNAIDDHIVLKEYNYDLKGNNRLVTIYIQINHDKVMRLWCDVDNSYDCWHVKYAWTLPEVLEWAQYHLQKGDIKDIENNSGDNEVGGD